MRKSMSRVVALSLAAAGLSAMVSSGPNAPSEVGARMGKAADGAKRLAGAMGEASRAVERATEAFRQFGGALRPFTRRHYPRKVPNWTNARYRRAAVKARNVARNRRAQR